MPGSLREANDQIILRQILEVQKRDNQSDLPDAEYFELFVAELALKKFGMSADEIDDGLMGGGGDGGIDAAYCFVEEQNLTQDPDLSRIPRDPTVDLFVIQTKTSTTFGEDAVIKLHDSLSVLLDLNFKQGPKDQTLYSPGLLEFFDKYRETVRSLAPKFPRTQINVIYATQGNTTSVSDGVLARLDRLRDHLTAAYDHCIAEYTLLGARELISLARSTASGPRELKFSDQLSVEGGNVCLVELRDYYYFIADTQARLRSELFTANVRDYEGDVEVNQGIRRTLASRLPVPDFWWLNNGVTIVASRVTQSGKRLMVDNPKIVNGLQTSHEIFRFFTSVADDPSVSDGRRLLVRVLESGDEATTDQIIQATNSQSRISVFALKANERVHRDIEDHFRYNGLFYERQKNFYRNQSKPRRQIVSIQFVAQAMAAVLLRTPNEARGRPTNLLRNQTTYAKVFSDVYPVNTFLKATQIVRRTEQYLRVEAPAQTQRQSTNLRFQVACYATCLILGCTTYVADDIGKIHIEVLDSEFLSKCVNDIWRIMQTISTERDWDMNQVSKNAETDAAILTCAENEFHPATSNPVSE